MKVQLNTKSVLSMLLIGLTASYMTACTSNKGLSVSSDSASTADIIGGVRVATTDAISSTTVSLLMINDDGSAAGCTGSIIAPDLILTAGHCPIGSSQILVTFSNKMLPDTTAAENDVLLAHSRQVVAVSVNPNYLAMVRRQQMMEMFGGPNFQPVEEKNEGDMAILKFVGGLPAGYKPIKLNEDPNLLHNGMGVVLAGYGWTNGVTHAEPDGLREVNMTIENAQYSASEISFNQTNGHGACHGDSGGPAIARVGGINQLVGITSRGLNDPNNDCSSESVYTSVSANIGWIKQVMQDFAGSADDVLSRIRQQDQQEQQGQRHASLQPHQRSRNPQSLGQ